MTAVNVSLCLALIAWTFFGPIERIGEIAQSIKLFLWHFKKENRVAD